MAEAEVGAYGGAMDRPTRDGVTKLDQTTFLGLPSRPAFFAFLSRRFSFRSLAAGFLELLPPLSLLAISASISATDMAAEHHCPTRRGVERLPPLLRLVSEHSLS